MTRKEILSKYVSRELLEVILKEPTFSDKTTTLASYECMSFVFSWAGTKKGSSFYLHIYDLLRKNHYESINK